MPTTQVNQQAIGIWGPTFKLPTVAIHAHLLPNQQVLFWGRRGKPDDSLDIHQTAAYILDPSSLKCFSAAQPKDNRGRQINLFCSGHNFLPDGRLLVTGGHYYDAIGLSQACVYDYRQDKWQAIDPMNEGRWYPTCVQLTNGAMLTFSGSFALEILINDLPQIWDGSKWSNLTKFEHKPPLYPRMHAMSKGRVFMSGPLATSYILDTTLPGTWTQLSARSGGNRDYAPSIEYRPGKIAFIGGGNDAHTNLGEEDHQPTNIVESIDLNEDPPKWTVRTPMKHRRRQHNATLLGDGTVLVTGGTQGGGGPQKGFNDLRPGKPVHTAEIWDPDSDVWFDVGDESTDRCYHGINLLLPDGRVLSAGGGEYRPNELVDTIFMIENLPKDSHRDAQIYSPPYMFKGPRPEIANCQSLLTPGQILKIQCSQSRDIETVRLVKLPSVTHSFSQSQSVIQPNIQESDAQSITVLMPTATDCVPGHYMLFLVNKLKIPSIAAIVQISNEQQILPTQLTKLNSDRLLIKAITPAPAKLQRAADQIEITVGLTPTCPYGLCACWGAAYEALVKLTGAPEVDDVPDMKNCTATLLLKNQDILRTYGWKTEFEKIANASYEYRGIEISVIGVLQIDKSVVTLNLQQGGTLELQEATQSIQWNLKKDQPVQLSPEETSAYAMLKSEIATLKDQQVRVIGRLQGDSTKPVLQVRQFKTTNIG